MTPLERAILDWARPLIQPREVGPWPLRAYGQIITDRADGTPGLWIHVHDDHTWVCSVRRTKSRGNITIEVPRGTKIVEVDE